MSTGNREQNCTMEGGLQYLHKARFILFSKSFVQRMASCTCMSCIFKNNNNINNNFRLAAYISRCAFLTCQHSTFPAGRAHTIYLFSIARFHDNIIKILLLASYQGPFNPPNILNMRHLKHIILPRIQSYFADTHSIHKFTDTLIASFHLCVWEQKCNSKAALKL